MSINADATSKPARPLFHLWILAFSLILLSPFGIFYLLNINGHYISEIGISLFILYLAKRKILSKTINSCIKTTIFIYPLIITSALFLIGLTFHGDILSAYSDFRVHVIFLLVFTIFYRAKGKYLLTLEEILLSTSLISLSLYLIFLMIIGNPFGSVKYAYPAAAYLSLMILSARKNNLFLMTASMSLCIVCAITSFYRGQWALAALAILISFGFHLKNNGPRGAIKGISWLITLTIIIAISFDAISYFVISYFNKSESAYIHSIGKVNGLIETIAYGGFQGGDDIRFSYFEYMTNNFLALMMPAGLGYDAQIGNVHSVLTPTLLGGTTLDSFYVFSLVHYGIFSLLLLILLISRFISVFERLGAGLATAILIWISIYASLSAAFVTELSFAFFTAATIGLIMNKNFCKKTTRPSSKAEEKLRKSQLLTHLKDLSSQ